MRSRSVNGVAVALFLWLITVLLMFNMYLKMQSDEAWIEVKYVIISKNNPSYHVEVVDKVWINGAPDYNNRPFKFRMGETVTVTCPEKIGAATFAFWQREEGPTFQGTIVSNRTLVVKLDQPKQIWWANYVLP